MTIITKIDNYLLQEAIPISLAKKYVAKFNRERYSDWFNNKYRVYLPINGNAINDTQIPKEIISHLNSKGYSIENYKLGLAKQKDGKRVMKIGKLLGDNQELQKKFNQDPNRAGTKKLDNEFLVVISRHPYDIAGMSLGRKWEKDSCMNIETGGQKEFVMADVKEGTLVAYLIKNDDKNIQNPISRILIKPYINKENNEDIMLVASDIFYGKQSSPLKDTVQNWLDDKQGKKEGVYCLNPKVYSDMPKIIFTQEYINKLKKWEGDLDLRNTPITSLPDNLKVGGSLDLRNSKIESLPDNLEVKGNLYLSNTPITSLPDNLKVGGSLDLSNSPITSLPDNLEVKGILDLSNTPMLKSLPDNLKVGGWLDLSYTKIKSLPDNLEVGVWLDLRNSKITSLPNNLKVEGFLDLRNTPLAKIEGVKEKYKKNVKGDIYI